MKQIRKLIQSYLQSLHPRVSFQVAPDNEQTPYITYDITGVQSDGEGLQVAIVDVDGWDIVDNNDTSALEDLMNNINAGLDKKTLNTDGMTMTLYLNRKIPVPDPDPKIRRRKYIYQARIIGRS